MMRCPGNKGYARVWLLASRIENRQQFVKEKKRSKRKPEGVRGSGTIRVTQQQRGMPRGSAWQPAGRYGAGLEHLTCAMSVSGWGLYPRRKRPWIKHASGLQTCSRLLPAGQMEQRLVRSSSEGRSCSIPTARGCRMKLGERGGKPRANRGKGKLWGE